MTQRYDYHNYVRTQRLGFLVVVVLLPICCVVGMIIYPLAWAMPIAGGIGLLSVVTTVMISQLKSAHMEITDGGIECQALWKKVVSSWPQVRLLKVSYDGQTPYLVSVHTDQGKFSFYPYRMTPSDVDLSASEFYQYCKDYGWDPVDEIRQHAPYAEMKKGIRLHPAMYLLIAVALAAARVAIYFLQR